MKIKQNIGLIECGLTLKPINISPSIGSHDNVIKKVLLTDNINKADIKLKYPSAEVVDDTKAIINDNSIELVIISNPSKEDMSMVGEFIHAGKYIRII